MRYCESLKVKWLQSYSPSNFVDNPIVQDSQPGCRRVVRLWPSSRIAFKPPTLTACNLAVLWPTEMYGTSIFLWKDIKSNKQKKKRSDGSKMILPTVTLVVEFLKGGYKYSINFTYKSTNLWKILIYCKQKEYWSIKNMTYFYEKKEG